MKNIFKSTILLLSVALVMNACDGSGESLINERLEENPLPTPATYSSGSADFSNFVAIGNSLTAGYMDGALYNLGQQNSIPNIMAEAFAQTTDGDYDFVQPFINSENGFNTVASPNPALSTILGRFQLDINVPGPSPVINGEAITAYNGEPVNNFGVPGIVTGQLLTPLTGGPADPSNPAFNPFYQRFASQPGTSTILGEAIAAQPTFFSLWIGNNDVLGYAASGASNPAILTSDVDFSTQYNAVIDQLMANTTAKGVVANIPPLLGTPVFQAVRWNNITLDAATAAAVNAGLGQVNQVIQGCANVGVAQSDIDQRLMSYSEGDNPILVIDEELDDEKAIRSKKIALKEQVAEARAYLDRQKSKYYEDIKAGSRLTSEQQEAINFYHKYNKDQEGQKKLSEKSKRTFLNKTDSFFGQDFKGFEYNVGDKVESLTTSMVGHIHRCGTNHLIVITEDGLMFKSFIHDVHAI